MSLVAYILAGTSMPGFSEMGISQISSVIRLTVMSVLSFILSGRDSRDSREKRDGFKTIATSYARRAFLACPACLAGSHIEDHAYLPAIPRLLEFVEVFGYPFHIGMEFLCPMI